MRLKEKIWLSPPHMGGQEARFVQQAFDTNWIAPLGPNVTGFEEDIASYLGGDVSVVVLSSGTAAIHLGLILLGIGQGDEVLCQSLTFSATANPVRYQGAMPIFIDSEKETWNMSPEVLEEAIHDRIKRTGKKPKAIVPVHLYGMPAKMKEIKAVAEKYEIPVLEDAAEALGSTLYDMPTAIQADIGVLSFNGNKIITTSGGGALVTRNPILAEKARYLSTQARDNAPHYQHSQIGFNYRMSNVCAGIGRGQMLVLQERVAKRRMNYEMYKSKLEAIKGISFVDEPDGLYSNRWLTTIIVDPDITGGVTREHIRLALEERNIESRPIWKPMHMQPVFSNCDYYGDSVAERLFEKGLCLPSGSDLNEEQISAVVETIEETMMVGVR